jgi:hypothetical protein
VRANTTSELRITTRPSLDCSENRLRQSLAANPPQVARPFCAEGRWLSWLSLAVIPVVNGRQRPLANSDGRLWTTADGFEDRGSGVQGRPPTSARIQSGASTIHSCSHLSVVSRQLGCHLGCQGPTNLATNSSAQPVQKSGSELTECRGAPPNVADCHPASLYARPQSARPARRRAEPSADSRN